MQRPSYLSAAICDDIRTDPTKIVYYYNLGRNAFIQDLTLKGVVGLTEDMLKAAWCTVAAYTLTPYGPNPGSTNLNILLSSPTMACAAYVSVTWQLIEQFGISTDIQFALGWDDGAVGNHAQMLMVDGNKSVLLDPTIGLIAPGVTYEGLIDGQSYQSLALFYFRPELDSFKLKVISALQDGKYKLSDAIYFIPTLDHWVNDYSTIALAGIRLSNDDGSIRLVGYLTDDRLRGTSLGDEIWGGKGNDTLDGGGGADTLHGGRGNDAYIINSLDDVVQEFAGYGSDRVYAWVDKFKLSENIETLVLCGAAVTGIGNNTDNGIIGNQLGNILEGLAGRDNLYGLQGNDILRGGAGNDILRGGGGFDTLVGGQGDDLFVFDNLNEMGTATGWSDLIVDFDVATNDRIMLSAIDADVNRPGDQAFLLCQGGSFSAPGQVIIFYRSLDNQTVLLLNTDNDAAPEGLIRLAGKISFNSIDFVL